MVKRLRFQENRAPSSRKRHKPGERWVFEPLDMVLATFLGALMLWLHWLLSVATN